MGARPHRARPARRRCGFAATGGHTDHADDPVCRLRAAGRSRSARRDQPGELERDRAGVGGGHARARVVLRASRIDLGALRRTVEVPVRLLGIGLPLTIALGAVAAAAIFDQLTVMEAVILAVVLAPTDAALGQAVVTELRVPQRIRQGLNVESGLNDGICVPLLFAAVAIADLESEISGDRSPATLLVEEIGYGVLGGVVAGLFIALIVKEAGRRDLIAGRRSRRPAPRLRTASPAGSTDPGSSQPSSPAWSFAWP